MNTDSAASAATEADDLFGPSISSYSRARAIEDGLLIDVSDTASEAGFKLPVALTRAAWEDCVEWSENDSARQTYQDVAGRLWDVLWMGSLAIRRAPDTSVSDALYFRLHRVPRGGRGRRPRLTTLKLLARPGDDGELVFTILLPDET